MQSKQVELLPRLQALRENIQTVSKTQGCTRAFRAAESKLALEFGELEKKGRKLRAQVTLYHLHLKQFETCRATIKKIEDNLVPGEALVYRDFVACYNCEGHKVQNLVLVVEWRTEVGGPLRVMKLNNYCSDPDSRSSDAHYVADVFEFHMRTGKDGDSSYYSNIFRMNKITTVFLSGDHGPHFSAAATIYNESTFLSMYGIRLLTFFLCSYHAYNRCDGAGVEGKRLGKAAAKDRDPIRTGGEYARAINTSRHFNSVGFTYDQIDRRPDRFPPLLVTGKDEEVLNLRQMCEIKYTFIGEDGTESREDGVILCRTVPAAPGDKGLPYEVYDLRSSPPGGALCRCCSKMQQRPVRHGGSMCTQAAAVLTDVHNLKAELVLVPGPNPSRISAFQQDKEYGKNLTRPSGPFPCRLTDSAGHKCSFHFFTMQSHANAHMKKKHGMLDNDALLYPPAKEQHEFPCKEPSCEASFKTTRGANSHLTIKHGYAADSVDLYADVTARKGVVRRKKRKKESSGSASAASDVPKENEGKKIVLRPRTSKPKYDEDSPLESDAEEGQVVMEKPRMQNPMLAAEPAMMGKYESARLKNIQGNEEVFRVVMKCPTGPTPFNDILTLAPAAHTPAVCDDLDPAFEPTSGASSSEDRESNDECAKPPAMQAQMLVMWYERSLCYAVVKEGRGNAPSSGSSSSSSSSSSSIRDVMPVTVHWLNDERGVYYRLPEHCTLTVVPPSCILEEVSVTLEYCAAKARYKLNGASAPTKQQVQVYETRVGALAKHKKHKAKLVTHKRRATATSDSPTTHDLPGNWDDVDWREVGGGKWDFECKLSKCKVGSFLLLEEVSTVNVYSLAVGKIGSVDLAKRTISALMFGPVLGTGSTAKACVTAKWLQRTPALVEDVPCGMVAYYFPALTTKNHLPPDAKSRVANMGLLDRLRAGTEMQATSDSDDDDDVPLSKIKVSSSLA